MRKIIMISTALVLGFTGYAYSHSGRTDKNGGHNCSAKSKQKGLCTGYHYHRQGDEMVGHSHEVDEKSTLATHKHK